MPQVFLYIRVDHYSLTMLAHYTFAELDLNNNANFANKTASIVSYSAVTFVTSLKLLISFFQQKHQV